MVSWQIRESDHDARKRGGRRKNQFSSLMVHFKKWLSYRQGGFYHAKYGKKYQIRTGRPEIRCDCVRICKKERLVGWHFALRQVWIELIKESRSAQCRKGLAWVKHSTELSPSFFLTHCITHLPCFISAAWCSSSTLQRNCSTLIIGSPPPEIWASGCWGECTSVTDAVLLTCCPVSSFLLVIYIGTEMPHKLFHANNRVTRGL